MIGGNQEDSGETGTRLQGRDQLMHFYPMNRKAKQSFQKETVHIYLKFLLYNAWLHWHAYLAKVDMKKLRLSQKTRREIKVIQRRKLAMKGGKGMLRQLK